MKATERTGDREGATRKRAGKSVLVMLTHPRNRKLYIPSLSIGEKEIGGINRGSFNNISG